jgi:hypothetical protein
MPDIQNIIGKSVIAKREYCGTYLGTVVGEEYFSTCGWKAKVKIDDVLEQPKQTAIFYKDQPYEREPYRIGTIESFLLKDIY